MNYTPYSPDNIQSMFFRWYNIKPYVYDPTIYTAMEMIGQAMEKVNEVIKETNDMGAALLTFENYVISELQKYDQKIIDEVTKIIIEKISDGTLANIINSIFNELKQNINNLSEEVQTEISQLTQEIQNQINDINGKITDINYKKPSVTLSILPSQTIYNKGETINSIVLNFIITKGTNNIIRAEIYKNDLLVSTLQNLINGNNSFTDGSIINTDTSYYIKIFDDKTYIQSEKIELKFINNYFYGVLPQNYLLNDTLIKSLNNLKVLKQNLNIEFNCNNQKILFAYPTNYGDLLEIKYNSINFIESFDKTIVLVDNVNYNVYITKNLLKDTFGIDFNIIFDKEISINTTNSNNTNIDG